MRRYYGVIEGQFENYFREAARVPGQTGKTFLQLLERRFDNVIYRLNLASSRKQARQIITHRHFRINGRICNIPSAILKPGDVISIGERSQKSPLISAAIESAKGARVPEWLVFDEQTITAKMNSIPASEHIDTPVDVQLIVEYYSR